MGNWSNNKAKFQDAKPSNCIGANTPAKSKGNGMVRAVDVISSAVDCTSETSCAVTSCSIVSCTLETNAAAVSRTKDSTLAQACVIESVMSPRRRSTLARTCSEAFLASSKRPSAAPTASVAAVSRRCRSSSSSAEASGDRVAPCSASAWAASAAAFMVSICSLSSLSRALISSRSRSASWALASSAVAPSEPVRGRATHQRIQPMTKTAPHTPKATVAAEDKFH
mmetsp:Transcript_5816/g.11668  ORF Transcript_5816/g.11668 Transcript_5816/m.11668 type:complete len:225 (+) Transcript_5816:1453-2127(+)